MSRDDTLFKDDDGKAYFVSAANENADLMLYELADDYLTIKRQVMRAVDREARGARDVQAGRPLLHHHVGGDRLGPEPGAVLLGASIEGPWTSLTNLGNSTTYDTQSAYVIPVQGSQATTYIYAGDRWQDPDLVGSKYIWLPLKISGDVAVARRLRRVAAQPDHRALVGGRRLHSRSRDGRCSTPTARRRRARTATPATPSTIRRRRSGTRSTRATAPAHPHEIQIDLGATLRADRLPLPPRQDKDDHGMVAQYQFYASTDRDQLGHRRRVRDVQQRSQREARDVHAARPPATCASSP